ncbi:leucyl/phenylalanyl-tRNA--protein transferase [Sphingomonas gilva]|uniref:Leucyl/phenylalanyl-tRNA--protein transferase n=1 Tax=Sphingomonas gilva TaxID=2305907 RepID=A0A396RLW9_9SPHN|nr:leucyl/phenylalanyl-tRNA--protein transferase [Sphingomonas gilva]RHW17387.1 leucyl/phenylalanyl-tRNA--protein transferase [Sphingomonas gilva]
MLLRAYAMGIFPMADSRDAGGVYWVEPRKRGILPLDRFHLSHSLRRTLVRDRFRVTADAAFESIIALCAEAAADREETWINRQIENAFVTLHHQGHAHSIEVWDGERLAGGLYGLALGGAFFGESMVSRVADASKVALAWLVARLRVGGFSLLDCQFLTPHLASLGAIEVTRADYMALLEGALSSAEGALGVAVVPDSAPAPWFGALDGLRAPPDPPPPPPSPSTIVSGPLSGKAIVQLLGQTS